MNVDSFMASFHECSIGNLITNCFIFSFLFKCSDDVIDIELPKIVYSVFNVTDNTLFGKGILYLYSQGSFVCGFFCILNLITSILAPFIGLNFKILCFS